MYLLKKHKEIHKYIRKDMECLCLTCLKLPLALCSHSIMSKKMGRVAFRSSVSGTRVTSRNGPTILGTKYNLWGPVIMIYNYLLVLEWAQNNGQKVKLGTRGEKYISAKYLR